MESVDEGKKPFECDHSVSQKGELKVHIESVHEGKKPFKCNVCDATFSQTGNLNCHIESQTLHLNDFFPS